MKGRIKLRIVQVYLHANFNNNNKKEILDLHAYIENLILKSYKENYRVIIMGSTQNVMNKACVLMVLSIGNSI